MVKKTKNILINADNYDTLLGSLTYCRENGIHIFGLQLIEITIDKRLFEFPVQYCSMNQVQFGENDSVVAKEDEDLNYYLSSINELHLEKSFSWFTLTLESRILSIRKSGILNTIDAQRLEINEDELFKSICVRSAYKYCNTRKYCEHDHLIESRKASFDINQMYTHDCNSDHFRGAITEKLLNSCSFKSLTVVCVAVDVKTGHLNVDDTNAAVTSTAEKTRTLIAKQPLSRLTVEHDVGFPIKNRLAELIVHGVTKEEFLDVDAVFVRVNSNSPTPPCEILQHGRTVTLQQRGLALVNEYREQSQDSGVSEMSDLEVYYWQRLKILDFLPWEMKNLIAKYYGREYWPFYW